MRKVVLLASLLLALVWVEPAFADEAAPAPSRRLLVQPRNADGSLVLPAFTDDPVLWLRGQQQNFYGAMSRAMKDMGGGTTTGGAVSLMLLSLGYGVFHAAGPGHGKAVISGWLLATRTQLRRGILVAFISAMIQALVAVALVSGALLLVSGAAAAAKDMAGWLETASFAMIGALGAYLLWTGIAALRGGAHADHHGHDHGHAHHDDHAGHDHDHAHHDHAHAPIAADVAGDWSPAKAFSLALAVGLRPCTGAILVLLFAYNMGIYWAGIAATFVMGLGTFATVAAIAAIAVSSKQLAERLAGQDARWLSWLNLALRLCGGLAIFIFGATLAYTSFIGGMADGGF